MIELIDGVPPIIIVNTFEGLLYQYKHIYWVTNSKKLDKTDQITKTMFLNRMLLIEELMKKYSKYIKNIIIVDELHNSSNDSLFGSSLRMKIHFSNEYTLSVIWLGPNISYGAEDELFEIAAYNRFKNPYRFKDVRDDVEGWCTPEHIIDRIKQIISLN